MTLRKRAPIRITIETFQKYLRKEIDLEALEHGLSSAASLLENDIPKPVRDAIKWANNQTDDIRLLTPKNQTADKVREIWRELEEVFSRHGVTIETELGDDA